MNTIIYAGPTLNKHSQALLEQQGLEKRPPVRRGDIERLNSQGFRGTIILVDGRFKEVLAVGHAEIREALENECTIYGLSSMGAIRAYEMESLGMKGYGKVFEYFKAAEDFQDDEVALLHGESPYYFSFSEPLVHFRECMLDLTHKNQVTDQQGKLIIDSLKNLYFGKRTMELFLSLIKKHTDVSAQEVKNNFEGYRIKQLDLIRFLEEEIWKKK